jgi:hypothetical protein
LNQFLSQLDIESAWNSENESKQTLEASDELLLGAE